MMRWLLAVLIVLNLGLFLWARMHVVSTQPSVPQSIRPPGVQDILLLRETDHQQSIPKAPELVVGETIGGDDLPTFDTAEEIVQETSLPDPVMEPQIIDTDSTVDTGKEAEESVAPEPVQPEPIVAEPVVVTPACGRIGPYTDKIVAEKHRDDYQHKGIVLDLLQTKEQVRKGYWVLIPALPSRREALQVVGRLKEAGVTDLWRFPNGPMKNAISLGWYSGIINATTHSGNINKKGFDSEVKPRMSEQTRTWLDYRAEDEQALSDWLDKMPTGLQNEKKACE